jgi:hypothetical protein
MFCRNCGKQIKDESVFCTHCGTRQIDLKTGITSVASESNVPVSSPDYKNNEAAAPAVDIAEDVIVLENMTPLLIVTLVFWVVFPLAGLVVYVYLLFRSRNILTQTKAVFESRGYALYADDIDDIRRRCEFIWSYMKYSLFYVVALIICLVGGLLLSIIAGLDFGDRLLAIGLIIFCIIFGLIGLCFFLVYFYALYQSVYCFIRFFKIKGYVYRLSAGGPIDKIPESSSTQALCLFFGYLALKLLIVILGYILPLVGRGMQ